MCVLVTASTCFICVFRSLPNWKNLQTGFGEQEEMSEMDLHAMNCKESSILTSNLSSTDALIPPQEVICDLGQLRALANMVESLASLFYNFSRSFLLYLRNQKVKYAGLCLSHAYICYKHPKAVCIYCLAIFNCETKPSTLVYN